MLSSVGSVYIIPVWECLFRDESPVEKMPPNSDISLSAQSCQLILRLKIFSLRLSMLRPLNASIYSFFTLRSPFNAAKTSPEDPGAWSAWSRGGGHGKVNLGGNLGVRRTCHGIHTYCDAGRHASCSLLKCETEGWGMVASSATLVFVQTV